MTTADLRVSNMQGPAALPRSNGELVFDEPWQGRAFGLAVGLSRRASFPWSDFVRRLSEQIASSPDDTTSGYYRQWLAALERTIVEQGITSNDELSAALADTLREHEHEHA